MCCQRGPLKKSDDIPETVAFQSVAWAINAANDVSVAKMIFQSIFFRETEGVGSLSGLLNHMLESRSCSKISILLENQ